MQSVVFHSGKTEAGNELDSFFTFDFLPFSTSNLQALRRSGSGNDPYLKDLSQSF
jgi:hypothetical protein